MRAIVVFGRCRGVVPAGVGAALDKDDVNPEEIIQKFAAKEAEFREARNNYTYRQTREDGGTGSPAAAQWASTRWYRHHLHAGGQAHREGGVRAGDPRCSNIALTPEDEQDLRNVQPFVLTTDEIPKYDISYLGTRESWTRSAAITFSVKPKKMEKGKRYFEGQIWVDDRDLQIVKTYGKGVGLSKQSDDKQFPKFETYREQIDGKYWFPTYTHADDTLHFKSGENVRIRMTVKYQDYKKFEGRSTITFGDVVDDKSGSRRSARAAATKKK